MIMMKYFFMMIKEFKSMKKNVVVIFGGDSSEHDVSCLSATTVIKNMDTEKYNVILVGITKEGKWLLVDGVKDIEDGSLERRRSESIYFS